MKTHILVATDGSDMAHAAVELAAELAAKFDVPLTVAHAYQLARPSEEMARMADVEHLVEHVGRQSKLDFNLLSGSYSDLFSDSRPSGEMLRIVTLIGDEILQRASDRAKELGARQVDTRSTHGDPADVILDMAGAVGADMIVVGHRGLGRLKTMLLGSVAQKVVQHAECTVVSVR